MSKRWNTDDDRTLHHYVGDGGVDTEKFWAETLSHNRDFSVERSESAALNRIKQLKKLGLWDVMTIASKAMRAHYIGAGGSHEFDEDGLDRTHWMLRNAWAIVALMEADEDIRRAPSVANAVGGTASDEAASTPLERAAS